MSQTQPPPSPPPAPAARAGGLLAALGCAVIFGGCLFAAVCAGVGYLFFPQAKEAWERADFRVPGAPAPLIGDVDDWWRMGVLSQIYASSLDTVTADPNVAEQLGQPVSTDYEAAELFRRTKRAQLGSDEEIIEFDVVGTKGRGTVSVVSSGVAVGEQRLDVKSITVTLEDGTKIDVPPPAQSMYQPR